MINWAGIYAGAKQWQGLLGSVIGFGGVMLTLSFNARLARRARAAEATSRRQGLRSALIVELQANYADASSCSQSIAAGSDPFVVVSKQALTEIYFSQLKELVLLPGVESTKVVSTYHFIRNMRSALRDLPCKTQNEDRMWINRVEHGERLSSTSDLIAKTAKYTQALLQAGYDLDEHRGRLLWFWLSGRWGKSRRAVRGAKTALQHAFAAREQWRNKHHDVAST